MLWRNRIISLIQVQRNIMSQAVNSVTKKHKVVFVLGGPGAGKGTQCENIVRVSVCRFGSLKQITQYMMLKIVFPVIVKQLTLPFMALVTKLNF